MTTDELRAAADTIRAVNQTSPDHLTPGAVRRLAVAAQRLVDSYPADDAEPVTADWLRAVGFSENGRNELLAPEALFYWYTNPANGAVTWWIGFRKLPDQPTRGHVRRLCAVLGVPLREGGANP